MFLKAGGASTKQEPRKPGGMCLMVIHSRFYSICILLHRKKITCLPSLTWVFSFLFVSYEFAGWKDCKQNSITENALFQDWAEQACCFIGQSQVSELPFTAWYNIQLCFLSLVRHRSQLQSNPKSKQCSKTGHTAATHCVMKSNTDSPLRTAELHCMAVKYEQRLPAARQNVTVEERDF